MLGMEGTLLSARRRDTTSATVVPWEIAVRTRENPLSSPAMNRPGTPTASNSSLMAGRSLRWREFAVLNRSVGWADFGASGVPDAADAMDHDGLAMEEIEDTFFGASANAGAASDAVRQVDVWVEETGFVAAVLDGLGAGLVAFLVAFDFQAAIGEQQDPEHYSHNRG